MGRYDSFGSYTRSYYYHHSVLFNHFVWWAGKVRKSRRQTPRQPKTDKQYWRYIPILPEYQTRQTLNRPSSGVIISKRCHEHYNTRVV